MMIDVRLFSVLDLHKLLNKKRKDYLKFDTISINYHL